METSDLLRYAEKRATKVAWGALVLGWSLFRAFAIRYFFKKYGINFWAYLAVDLTTSIPYAKYSGELVIAFLKKNRRAMGSATALTALFFYLPDIYVIFAAHQVPVSLWSGFAISMAFFSAIAVWQIVQSVRKGEGK